jgi:RimJ/RimL family protein N-acetyltransferase
VPAALDVHPRAAIRMLRHNKIAMKTRPTPKSCPQPHTKLSAPAGKTGAEQKHPVHNGRVHIILETRRLTLRRFTKDDVDNLFDLNNDPEVMRYLTGGKPTPRAEIRDEIIPFHLAVYQRFDRLGTWAAESSATGEFLGWFHFRPGPGTDTTNIDLGYRLRRPAWNKGYATEGSRALISMGFTDLGVERLFGHTLTVNTASRRVMEKCGLELVRTVPYEGPDVIEGSEHGEVEYALTKSEWEPLAASGA